MTKIDKDQYSAEEVRILIRNELQSVEDKLKSEIEQLNTKISSQKKEHQLFKQHLTQLASHIEKMKKGDEETVQEGSSVADIADINDAISEIKEVERHVKKAIGAVIARAEKMEKLVTGYVFAEKNILLKEITRIYEDCNVQDLTSQRIKKVLTLLGDKETVAKNKTRVNADGISLEAGPQLPENAMSQEDIDKMLKDL